MRHARRAKLGLAGVAVVSAVLFGAGLGARDLWNPNEPAYGIAVREMAERDAWLVPTVNGQVFAEKPPLYFWAARVSAGLAGHDESTLRWPSWIAGLVVVLSTYALARLYGSERRAHLTAWLTATTFMVFWGARTIQMDILVAATTIGCVALVARSIETRVGRRAEIGRWAVVGVVAGLGFLAKGPVGFILPAIAVGGYVFARAPIVHRAGFAGWWAAPGSALAIAVGWMAAAHAVAGDAFLAEMLFRQNVGRFVEAWDHAEPWWYYLKYFWIDMAPWAPLVAVAPFLRQPADVPTMAAAPSGDPRRLERVAWFSIVGTVLFFSLSDSKRSAYILPVAPFVAIVAAGVLERFRDARLSRAGDRAVALVLATTGGVLALLGGAVVSRISGERYPDLVVPGRIVGVVAIVAGVAAVLASAAYRSARGRAIAVTIGAVCAVYFAAGTIGLPAADPYKSARGFTQAVAGRVEDFGTAVERAEIASFGLWDWRASYAYYLGRTVPNLEDERALLEYWSREAPRFVIVERSNADRVEALLGTSPDLERSIGGNAAFLFVSDRAQDGNQSWQPGQ